MADASSIRYAKSGLPTAAGRNRGSLRFDTVNGAAKVSDGVNWVDFSTGPLASYLQSGQTFASQAFFVAPQACVVNAISEVHAVAGSDGGAVTAVVTKDTGTQAPGAGTSLHASGSFNLKGTANTVQTAVLSGTLATLTLAAGDRLSVKLTGTPTALAGTVVTAQILWI